MKITVRELAEELNISRQAIFNQMKRNPELASHMEKQGNKYYIDEVGQNLIRDRSIGRPQTMVTDQSMLNEVDKLRKENSALKDTIIGLQANQYKLMETIANTKTDNQLLLESEEKLRKVSEENNELREENSALQDENQRIHDKAASLLHNASWRTGMKIKVENLVGPIPTEQWIDTYTKSAEDKISELKAQLEQEKAKTWWDKLRGK